MRGVEHVEGRVHRERVGLVGDGGVHPGGEHLGPTGVRVDRDVEVGGRQVEHRVGEREPDRRLDGRVGRLRLVRAHQRAAAGVADDDDGVDTRLLAQPPHARGDVDERVLEQEERLVAAVPGVPAEEPEASLGEGLGEVVLGEVDVVVRRDARHLRRGARRPVVEALARVRSVPGTSAGGGREGHPLPLDGRHAAVTVGERRARDFGDGPPRLARAELPAASLAACGGDDGDVRAADGTTTSTAGRRRADHVLDHARPRSSTPPAPTRPRRRRPAARPAATTTTTRPPSPPVTAQPQVLPFAATIETVTAQDLYASWRPGCPVPVEQLRAIDVRHFGNDGAVHTGRLIVAANLANGMVDVFRDLYNARFPIERMEPIDVYGGDDMRSIKANNTSAFNCRAVTGGSGWSEHAYGRAIDVNPFVNPYVKGSTVLPPEAAPYTDRSRNDPGMIHADDAVVRAFAARGWKWGGYWSSLKDYQHFSTRTVAAAAS